MRVLVIEDDSEIVEFVTIAFEMAWPGATVKHAHLGKQGVDLIKKETFNLVILDLKLPDIDGYDVLRNIRRASSVPVIIASVRSGESETVKGLEYGADDYIVKPFGQLELVARARAVLRRAQEPTIYTPIINGPVRLEPGRGELLCGSKKIHITRTESLILSLLLQNVGQLVTYNQFEEVIWGEPGICLNAPDSIRVYVSRLRAKLAVNHDCPMSIRAHAGAGYILTI